MKLFLKTLCVSGMIVIPVISLNVHDTYGILGLITSTNRKKKVNELVKLNKIITS